VAVNISILHILEYSYRSAVTQYKKLIRRWDSGRELSLPRTTKYNRLVHKFRHRSTRRLCWNVYVYQIQWNNAMWQPLRRSRSFKVTDFNWYQSKAHIDFLLVINVNSPPILGYRYRD